ncbi:interferon-induced protein 44 [Rhynchocyon petersi]
MAVTTRMTWRQEKHLQNHFGGKQFSLLYKASVHGFTNTCLLQRCAAQGPTVTVIYGEDNVIGAYTQKSYQEVNKGSVTLFAFKISEFQTSGFEVQLFNTYTEKRTSFFYEDDTIYYENCALNIDLERKIILMDSTIMKTIGLPLGKYSFQECEVFRCEDLLDQRSGNHATEFRDSLLCDMKTYKPCGGLVDQSRILFLGPTGSGKSSFINSVKSVFRGRVTNLAVMNLFSNQFRTYFIKDMNNECPLPFILCDSMGLKEEEDGLCMDDVIFILKGHIPDRYQFNSTKPMTASNLNYIDSPLLKDKIHCVAFVLDCNSIKYLSDEMTAKIRRLRREVIKCGMAHVALLTHIDDLDLITKADLTDPYRCMPVKLMLEEVHRKLGFPLSNILVVSNYTCEWELDLIKDAMILSALKQMLCAADDFLGDLPPEETGRENW